MFSYVESMLSHVSCMNGTCACCSVLQRVAVYCSMLQCVAVLCWACQTTVFSYVESCCIYETVERVLYCVAVCCGMFQYVAVLC